MALRELSWQVIIFENGDLLANVKSFWFWSFRPQYCLTCCWEELTAAP